MENRKNDSSELLQLASFLIGSEKFGGDILSVQEVNKMLQVTKAPNASILLRAY